MHTLSPPMEVTMSTEPVLAKEVKYFEEILPALLLEHAGKVVLIKAREVLGVFGTTEEALGFATAQGVAAPYLVRPILTSQPGLGLPAMCLALLNHPA